MAIRVATTAYSDPILPDQFVPPSGQLEEAVAREDAVGHGQSIPRSGRSGRRA